MTGLSFRSPSHSLWMFIQNKTVTKQHQSLPSRQHIYLLLQYDWHSCVSRTFLHGAHSPIAFLSFSLSLSVVQPTRLMPDYFCCEQDVLGGNGILLWWTQLRAHRPRGAVPPECSPWDGQVRASKQRGFILMCAVLWLTVGACVGVYRYLIQGLDWIDARYAGMSSWDQRLPPPAAKTAVQTLTVIVITAEQAGRQNHDN